MAEATKQDWYKEWYQGYKKELDQIKAGKDPNRDVNPERAVLYRYFNAAGELLYIGVSIRPIHRQASHISSTKWWPEVTSATFERGFHSEQELYTAEAEAIKAESPKYNLATGSVNLDPGV